MIMNDVYALPTPKKSKADGSPVEIDAWGLDEMLGTWQKRPSRRFTLP